MEFIFKMPENVILTSFTFECLIIETSKSKLCNELHPCMPLYRSVPIYYILFYLTGNIIQLVMHHKDIPGSMPVMQKYFPLFYFLTMKYFTYSKYITKCSAILFPSSFVHVFIQ